MALEAETVAEAIGLALAETETRAAAAIAAAETRAAAALDTLQGDIVEALDDLDTRTAAALQARFADMLERMAAEIGALPPPDPGEPGAPGRDGRDGIDRQLALPRAVRSGDTCEANEIAVCCGGIWQAVRVTSGGPEDDPAGWKCLVPGVTDFTVREDMAARELVFAARMSDGRVHECRARQGACQLPPDYLARGWGVLAGDTLRAEGADVEAMALRDGALLGQAADWSETRLRGFRGQKGPPGERGPPGDRGPGLVGLDLARGDAGLVLIPRYADPAVEAEPIAIDFLVNDPGPAGGDRAPIACFAGAWTAAKPYARGDAVRAVIGGVQRLCLSIKPDNTARPDDARAWLVMV